VEYLKVFTALWPYLKEWFFGGKTVAEAYRDNKRYTIVVFLFLAVLLLSLWEFKRLYVVSAEKRDMTTNCPPEDSKSSNIPGATVNEAMRDIAIYLACQEDIKECDTP
jgi:hypothetical protein